MDAFSNLWQLCRYSTTQFVLGVPKRWKPNEVGCFTHDHKCVWWWTSRTHRRTLGKEQVQNVSPLVWRFTLCGHVWKNLWRKCVRLLGLSTWVGAISNTVYFVTIPILLSPIAYYHDYQWGLGSSHMGQSLLDSSVRSVFCRCFWASPLAEQLYGREWVKKFWRNIRYLKFVCVMCVYVVIRNAWRTSTGSTCSRAVLHCVHSLLKYLPWILTKRY